MPGAIADCERVLSGFLGQPVNAATSLAFVVAGLAIAGRSRSWVAAAMVATGLGSFLFHGPMPPGSQWAHDVSLGWLLIVVGATGTRWQRLAGWPALAALGVLLALVPGAADLLAAVTATVVIGSLLWRDRTPRTWWALGLLALGAGVGRLSATGGPWCVPESVFQGHGFWHLAAAGAVALWATGEPAGT